MGAKYRMRASEFLFPCRQTLLDQSEPARKLPKRSKAQKPRKPIKPIKPKPTQVLAAPPKPPSASRTRKRAEG